MFLVAIWFYATFCISLIEILTDGTKLIMGVWMWRITYPLLFTVTIYSHFFCQDDTFFNSRLFDINVMFHSLVSSFILILVSTSLFDITQERLKDYVTLFTVMSAPSIITGFVYIYKKIKKMQPIHN